MTSKPLEPQDEKQNADVQNDPNTPPEQLKPIDVQEVDEDGPEPGEEWGKDGQGSDDETKSSTGDTTGDGK